MTFSPLIDQRTLSPAGSTDCGEASVAMVLQHLGHNVSVDEVLALHSSYTDIGEVQNLLIHFGITGTYITGQGFDNNDKLAIALFHDDNNANPAASGSFEHYSVVYDQPGGNTVQVANPWGGRDINYPDSLFNPAFIAAVIIPVSVNQVGSAPAAMPATTSPPGGALVITAAEANGLSLLADLAGIWRERGQTTADAAGLLLANGDLAGLVQSIAQSDEGQRTQRAGGWLKANLEALQAAVTTIATLRADTAALTARVTALENNWPVRQGGPR